eukprot:CAMPEP_0113524882 /NCGR_PEP_ID=MMETSP0014_2-20120614/46444_1 /TAXON_ID=2857 /ORGANISM="Nitzschia sp." /LENGTH=363 /DNA_ID=CAMNT_0000423005 /DNA_START=137 /DNA_END=1228 /DNA_ORIENTATION=+ /assembly_acc=CAM_ASM_000159
MTSERAQQPSFTMMVMAIIAIIMSTLIEQCYSFAVVKTTTVHQQRSSSSSSIIAFKGQQQPPLLLLFMTPDEEDSVPDPEGADIAAALFAAAQAKGVSLDADDLMDDDDDDDDDDEDFDEAVVPYDSSQGDDDGDDDDDDDEAEPNIPQGAINAFLGYDTGDVGEKLAGDVSLTNDQLYSEVKERVLDTAGGFVDMVRGADDNEDDDGDGDGGDNVQKPYQPPTNVPDSDLTAGEVILLVLQALKNNNNPTVNKGVEVLFGYSSSGSAVKNEDGLTPSEYADFLRESEYNVLFEHSEVSIEKGDYSFDGKKAFFTARLQVGPRPLDFTSCNFQMSSEGVGDDAAWLIDSILIRPESMRRRRRK